MVAFSMPSVNSVFPFLEMTCPKNDPAWIHFRSAVSISVPVTLVSIGYKLLVDVAEFEHLEKEKGYYLLCWVPKQWEVEGIRDQLLRVCSNLHDSHVCIVGRVDFDKYLSEIVNRTLCFLS
jgi:hypothetical protein